MGGKSSKEKPNQPQENDEKAEEAHAEAIRKENEKTRKFLDSVKESMEHDRSPANIVNNYGKLRSFLKIDIHTIGKVVDEMTQSWKDVIPLLDEITKWEPDGPILAKKIEKLHNDYFSLLLKSKLQLCLLKKKAELQKSNIRMMSDLLNKNHKKGSKPDDDEKEAYKECLHDLGEWIQADSIDKLVAEWKGMMDRISDVKNDIKGKGFVKYGYGYCRARVFKCLGKSLLIGTIILAVIGSIVAIIVATGGAAGAALTAAAVAVTSNASVHTAAYGFTVMAAYGFTCVEVASVGYAYTVYYKLLQETGELRDEAKATIKGLEQMLTNSKVIRQKLNDVSIAQQEMESTVDFCKNKESYLKMKDGLDKLDDCLDEFIKQSNGATKSIDKAIKQFVKK